MSEQCRHSSRPGYPATSWPADWAERRKPGCRAQGRDRTRPNARAVLGPGVGLWTSANRGLAKRVAHATYATATPAAATTNHVLQPLNRIRIATLPRRGPSYNKKHCHVGIGAIGQPRASTGHPADGLSRRLEQPQAGHQVEYPGAPTEWRAYPGSRDAAGMFRHRRRAGDGAAVDHL